MLARKDTDWWIDLLYDFAADLDATIVRTGISHMAVDVNWDPYGKSLHPGHATTELCPTTTFDGEPLYSGATPDEAEIDRRYGCYFTPCHSAISVEIARLRAPDGNVVLYDCHSIRSAMSRVFLDVLPDMNFITSDGGNCGSDLVEAIVDFAANTPFAHVLNGRFRGGIITRHYSNPSRYVHAMQMELACRPYMNGPSSKAFEADWPTPYQPDIARPMRSVLQSIVAGVSDACAGKRKEQ